MSALDAVRQSQRGLAKAQGGDTTVQSPDLSRMPGYPTSEPAKGNEWDEARIESNGQGEPAGGFGMAAIYF